MDLPLQSALHRTLLEALEPTINSIPMENATILVKVLGIRWQLSRDSTAGVPTRRRARRFRRQNVTHHVLDTLRRCVREAATMDIFILTENRARHSKRQRHRNKLSN